jgi:hypothetical protein
MASARIIQNTCWTVSDLIGYINQTGTISKPKFQRKLRWTVLPSDKKKTANMQEFIDFLYVNRNTVQPISFGEKIENGKKHYENIDGNNRINSISLFMKTPFHIYPEHLEDLIVLVSSKVPESAEANPIIQFIKNISYRDISTFTSLRNLKKKSPEINTLINTLFQNVSPPDLESMEEHLEKIREKMLIDGLPFDNVVKLNVNIFIEYTSDKLCQLFASINKYSSSLFGSDLLASELYETHINILHDEYNLQIRKEIQCYYDAKNTGEVLSGYTIPEINTFLMNGFDCIVGLQNYCHRSFPHIIDLFDPDEIGIFFKLYKALYGGEKRELKSAIFTNDNMNEFTTLVIRVCSIANDTMNQLLPSNIGETIFPKSIKRESFRLNGNSSLFLFSTIIGMLRNPEFTDKSIIDKLQIPIAYYFILSELPSGPQKTIFRTDDKLSSISNAIGGNRIPTRAEHLLKDPEMVYDRVDKSKMRELIYATIQSSIETNTSPYQKGKKRRGLTRVERILCSAYYNKHMPNMYLQQMYSLEHIIPISCSWSTEFEVDIERLGNLVPFLISFNKGRGNRNISYYEDNCKEFVSFLKQVPNQMEYSKIVEYVDKYPTLLDPPSFSKFCERNERIYVDTFLDSIYAESDRR